MTDTRSRTFVADPPWRYDNTSSRGAAENHYSTMSIEELAALRVVPDNAADEALLFLWVTSSHLPHAHDIIHAWGFDEVVESIVWQKINKNGTPFMGIGNYFRMGTEIVLVASRGGADIDRTVDMSSVFPSLRRKHSQKPPELSEMVTELSPGPYMELFSRCNRTRDIAEECMCAKCRLGWTVWGNQS
ncbi:MT-A70 family methyltransferase [Mycobacteroides abscessus]|uniref:MT-A70 family methyltransferase n=1 Tax=Mycobacteroides abscessus TaxID=36809 RepID=UPI000C25B7AD|nr:MT-A70 family methyltransferase [Mycobacteroides abscessus]AWG55041.1 hypothetical protein DDT53_12915 [Mycobacteroides abscessus]MDQ8119626.1 MT-A70 family methyltransferase [Mycobacteroides abscessus subsp. massiliense]